VSHPRPASGETGRGSRHTPNTSGSNHTISHQIDRVLNWNFSDSGRRYVHINDPDAALLPKLEANNCLKKRIDDGVGSRGDAPYGINAKTRPGKTSEERAEGVPKRL